MISLGVCSGPEQLNNREGPLWVSFPFVLRSHQGDFAARPKTQPTREEQGPPHTGLEAQHCVFLKNIFCFTWHIIIACVHGVHFDGFYRVLATVCPSQKISITFLCGDCWGSSVLAIWRCGFHSWEPGSVELPLSSAASLGQCSIPWAGQPPLSSAASLGSGALNLHLVSPLGGH